VQRWSFHTMFTGQTHWRPSNRCPPQQIIPVQALPSQRWPGGQVMAATAATGSSQTRVKPFQ
jgi:hypothetical protein